MRGAAAEWKERKASVWRRLEALGVKVDWSVMECGWKRGNRLRVWVREWPDGTATVNLVDVPVELARECVELGLARGTRW